MDGEDIGTALCIDERNRNCHLAAHRRICRLELIHFDHLLVGHELYEVAMVGVGVRGCLASPGRLIIRE